MSLNSSASVPSLVSLESRRPSSFSFSTFPPRHPAAGAAAAAAPFSSTLSHAVSTVALGSLPSSTTSSSSSSLSSSSASASSPSVPLSRPATACCYVSVGHHWSTGVLCSHLGVYFILTSHRLLPDANTATSANAVFNYQTPTAARVTFDPSILFLTSPSDSLDFTLVSLSHASFNRLEELDLLQVAYSLDDHVDKASLARHMPLDIYQHHPLAPLQLAPGYLHCQYPTWIAYAAACHPKGCGGLIVRGDELVGLHRCRNDSRRWNEGTLIADIVPLVTPYLQAAKQRAASQSWLARVIKPITPPQSPFHKERKLLLQQHQQQHESRSLSPPRSPKVTELLVVREKGRIDVLGVLLIAAVLLGWLLHGGIGGIRQQLSDGVHHLQDNRWTMNVLAVTLVLAFHSGLYYVYRRWRQQPSSVPM